MRQPKKLSRKSKYQVQKKESEKEKSEKTKRLIGKHSTQNRQTATALRGFTRQFKIEGVEGFGEGEFCKQLNPKS